MQVSIFKIMFVWQSHNYRDKDFLILSAFDFFQHLKIGLLNQKKVFDIFLLGLFNK
jgi:hypothetical protein